MPLCASGQIRIAIPATHSTSASTRARVNRSPSTSQANSAAQIGIV